MRRPGRPATERFWKLVQKTPSCWLWVGSRRSSDGHGQFQGITAHRFAYELLVGPIKPGYRLVFLCSTPTCVNPDHLEQVTRRESILRGQGFGAMNARKTHCIRGHPFTTENTRWENGWRRCRACDREKQKARRK